MATSLMLLRVPGRRWKRNTGHGTAGFQEEHRARHRRRPVDNFASRQRGKRRGSLKTRLKDENPRF